MAASNPYIPVEVKKKPGRKLRWSFSEIAMALRVNEGMSSYAAKALGMKSISNFQRYLERWPKLVIIQEEAKEAALDRAESTIQNAIKEGDIAAAQFFLKTQGKARGYGNETNVNIQTSYKLELPQGFPMQVLQAPSDAIDIEAEVVEPGKLESMNK